MAKNGLANGIVGLGNIFEVGSTAGDVFDREDDLLSPGVPEENKADKDKDVIKKDDVVTKVEKVVTNNDVEVVEAEKKDVVKESSSIDYKKIISILGKKGAIPSLKDVVFEIDEKNVSIEDMDIDSEEMLCDVIHTVLSDQKEDIMKNMIDAGSVSEFTKKLIQADKSGANILDILKTYDKTSAPIESLDLESKSDQLKIIRHYVNLIGLPKDEAEDFYNSIVSKGDDFVEAKAIRYKSELDKRMDSIIQEQTRQAEQKKAKDIEDFKRYKKDLKQSISSKFQLNETMISKAMDFALKESGNIPGVTKASERVRDMLMNPEEAPDLILFLMNPDEFVKQKSNERVIEEKKKTYRMISQTQKDRKTGPVDEFGSEVKGLTFEETELK